MHEKGLADNELDMIQKELIIEAKKNKNRFMEFTDVVIKLGRDKDFEKFSRSFQAICAKACFLRGMYNLNQELAKRTDCIACRGYAAAAYCRQSLNPRWLNNLRNYVNQGWQSKQYIIYAELAGQLAGVLIDLGYAEHALDVANDSIEKVTKATMKDEEIRRHVQLALLRPRIIMAYISGSALSRDEALIRLDSAEETANLLDHRLAIADIQYYRARTFEEFSEIDRAIDLVKSSMRKYERMGHLQGLAQAGNLLGILMLDKGLLQDARDQFEDIMLVQHQLNNQIGVANTLINVGEIDRVLGQLDNMERYNQRALEISQEAEYVKGIATAKINLGDVELRRGQIEESKKTYDEAIRIGEKSGQKAILTLAYFLSGDACFISQDYKEAIQYYESAGKVSKDVGYPLREFNAEISKLITHLEMEVKPDNDSVRLIRNILGESSEWTSIQDSSHMIDIRRTIFENPNIQSDTCIFYDPEKNFECRVERTTMKKECFGNLFWQGTLCPYFADFIATLDSQ